MDEHLRDELVVAGGRRIPERFHRQAVRPEPPGGPVLDRRCRGGLGCGERGAGVCGEQGMDPEPASSFEARDEEVRALELGEDGGGARAVERSVAELCGELAERRDAVEKRPLLLVERREDLHAQILGHEALVAVEATHGGGRIGDRPQQEAGKHERRRPALRLLVQQFELLRPELDLAAGHQQLARLCAGERELARP